MKFGHKNLRKSTFHRNFPYLTQISKMVNKGEWRTSRFWPIFSKISISLFRLTTVADKKKPEKCENSKNWFKKAYQLVWEFLSWLEVSILMHWPLLAVPFFQFVKIRLFSFSLKFFSRKRLFLSWNSNACEGGVRMGQWGGRAGSGGAPKSARQLTEI